MVDEDEAQLLQEEQEIERMLMMLSIVGLEHLWPIF
jgi:hypothetical protein